MGHNRIVQPAAFSARTDLSSELATQSLDGDLDGLRVRWNQFGVATLIRVEAAPRGITVRYRLIVDGHPDPEAVHAAFQGDLDAVLAQAAAPPIPVSWDLAAMAQAAAETGAASAPAPARAYVEDAGYDWSG